MRTTTIATVLGASLCAFGCEAKAPGGTLPLKSLTLYETGVGYFEREGKLKSGAVAEIPLEPAQLDDALKTLVIISPGGVASIEYVPPLAPKAARAQAGLPDPAEPTLHGLLKALKGVAVRAERKGGAELEGRVMDVEGPAEGDASEETPNGTRSERREGLLLFGSAGLSRIPLDDLTSVKPLDPKVSMAWDRASASEAAPVGRRALRVRGGAGTGRVAVGYATEAAVWRTTYRFVLGEHLPRLQGFGVVHNDSDEAWDGVRVTLVAGKPTSFLYPLAGPRYGRRELVSPPEELDEEPQLATEEAHEHMVGSAVGEAVGSFGLGTSGVGGGGTGYGMGMGSISTKGKGGGAGTSSVILEGPTPLEPAAVSEAGDLFLYAVKDPVHLAPRHSALLPIVDTSVEAERVSVVDAGGSARHGVRFVNSTGLTLEGGVVTVFTDGAYAGEAQVDRVKTKEVRVLRYAEDLDIEVERRDRTEEGPARQVRRVDSTLEIHRVDRMIHELAVTSRSDKGRTLLVELPERGFAIASGAQEDVRSPGQSRYARLTVGPREKADFSVVEQGGVAERLSANAITVARVDGLLKSGELDEASRAALQTARADAGRAEDSTRKRGDAERRMAEAEKDLERLRESVEAAGKGGARVVADALAAKLLAAEGRVEKWRAARDEAEAAAQEARKALLSSLGADGR